MKRVKCLYRVSTKKQVDKNTADIPMQKNACRAYAKTHPDWVIIDEREELGISGSKVSAKNRDEVIGLQESAKKGEFDVLLVFMFDRIGRIDDETPHIVEWFIRQGIEVWSVKEGEQKLESHSDKLINYIRYWQAAGESQKLSMQRFERRKACGDSISIKNGVYPCWYGAVSGKQYEPNGIYKNDAG